MSRTRFHLLFLFSAVVVAVVLGIHMGAQHLNNIIGGEADPTSYQNVIARSADGGWVVLYMILLAFGLYHALYGLRGIVLELTTSESAVRIINWTFVIGGILVFGWGTYVLFRLL